MSGRSRVLKVEILGDAKDLGRAFDKAGQEADGFGSKLGGIAATGAVALAGIGIAAGASAVNAIGAFSGFQEQMNEVFTLLPGISEDAMGEMTDQVKTFSKEFGVLPEDVVPALYQSLSAGVPPDNVFAFLETAQKAAKGGVTELETAVDGISSVINAYGTDVLSAGEASDQMFTAVRLGKTNFEELSSSLFNVIPTAASMGVAFGDVTAALATMTAQGTPTSVATTQLRQVMVEASKAGSDLDLALQDLTGKSFTQLIEEGNSVADVLQLVRENAGSDDEFRNLFGSVEAMNAALAITGPNFETFNANLSEMETSAGATDAAFQQMDSGIGASTEKIKANLSVLRLEAGEQLAPAFEKLTNFILDPGLPALSQFGDEVGQRLAPILADLGTWFREEGIPALTEFGEFIVNDVVPVLEEMGEFIANDVLPVLREMGEWMVEEGIPALQDLGEFARAAFEDVIQPAIEMLAEEALPELIKAWEGISEEVIPTIEALQLYIETVFGAIQGFLEDHWETISAIASRAWEYISETIGNLIEIISETIQLAMNIIQGDWEGAWENIKAILNTAKDQLIAVGELLKDGLIALFNLMRDEGVQIMQNLADQAIEKLVALGDWILTEGAPALVSKMVDGLQMLFSEDTARGVLGQYIKLGEMVNTQVAAIGTWLLNEGGPALVSKLVEGLGNLFSVDTAVGVVGQFYKLQTAINTATGEIVSAAAGWGADIVQGIIDGFASMTGELASAVGSYIVETVKDSVTSGFGIFSPSLVMQGYGHDIVEGFAIGIEERRHRAEDAGYALGVSVIDGTDRGMDDGARAGGALPAEAKPKPVGVAMGRDFGEGTAEGVAASEGAAYEAGQRVGGAIAKGTKDGLESIPIQPGDIILPSSGMPAPIDGSIMESPQDPSGAFNEDIQLGDAFFHDERLSEDQKRLIQGDSNVTAEGGGSGPLVGEQVGSGGSIGPDTLYYVGSDDIAYILRSPGSQPQVAYNWLARALEKGVLFVRYTGGSLGGDGTYKTTALMAQVQAAGALPGINADSGGNGALAVLTGSGGSGGGGINLVVNLGNEQLVDTVLSAPLPGMSLSVEV